MTKEIYQTQRSPCTYFRGFLLLLLIFQTLQPLFGLHNKQLSIISVGRPEEVFSASDQLESNYDEYPMVVPKRAALLLDRLMVALHHALEKEHGDSTKLSEFYNNKNSNINNNNNKNIPAKVNERNKDAGRNDNNDNNQDSPYLAMYSDDDPSVMMDYDFKDLNSINRATGETLMAQGFQRRANVGLDLGGNVGVEGVSSLLDTSSSSALSRGLLNGYNNGDSNDGGVGAVVGVGGGRTVSSYWRCYFNAVSCF